MDGSRKHDRPLVATRPAGNPPAKRLPRAGAITWPGRNDPRLRLAAVVTTLQILGQVSLGWKVSVAQIVITVAVCGLVEGGITYWRKRQLIWPASAMLTGNSTALLLRTTGTQHGDWFSMNGIQFFVFAAVLGLLSKYAIRVRGRHVYNPSNLGLVAAFIILGPGRVFPQYLWWGPVGGPVVGAWIIIIAGGIWVLRPLKMWPMVLAFVVPFAALIGLFAAHDQCFYAVWRTSPVCASNYWIGIAASPELFIFVLLMMSDPRTTPRSAGPRALFGAATALVAAGLIWPQPSEFGVKVALLASLTVVCTFVPLIELGGRALETARRAVAEMWRPATVVPLVAALAICAAIAAEVVAISGNRQITNADRHPSTSVFGRQ